MNPLKQRDRLRQERRAAQTALDTAAARSRELERVVRREERERALAARRRARGHEDAAKQVQEAESRREAALAERERLKADVEAAADARAAVEVELGQLYQEHLPDFAKEAEKVTQKATDALVALEEPYMAAVSAWAQARGAWRPLALAIAEALKNAEDEAGIWPDERDRWLSAQVPDCPLPEPQYMFDRVKAGQVAARPAAMRPRHRAT